MKRTEAAQKTLQLSAWHFKRMGKFLWPIYTLLLAAEVLFAGWSFYRSLTSLPNVTQPVSFQEIFGRPVLPILFYAAYGLVFAGALLYFLRFAAGAKSTYTLRTLPVGSRGMLWGMLLPAAAAVLLLYATQLLAVYAGYGVYRLESLLCTLPGGADGASRLFGAPLPAAGWVPPENELYLTFVRTAMLQLFYPRHPVFWLLAAALLLLLPVGAVYLAISFYGRSWGAVIPAAVAAACEGFAISNAQSSIGAWRLEDALMVVPAMLLLAGGMVYMLLAAAGRLRRSELG
ncbi:MAG TPA: hypothetical protein IAD07_07755 [Candidatus Fimivicinus intestinavium]|nr:hypothetical protein [Candidatus Fimivicinus intestinavium]